MTPSGFTKYGSGEQVSPSEFSPGLLDLHSFDTELLTEVQSENNLNLLNQPSYGEGLDEFNAYSLTSKFANFSCGENNAVKSSLADKEKASNVAKIKVVVRKRPLNKKELSKREKDIISIDPYSGSLTVHESKVKLDLQDSFSIALLAVGGASALWLTVSIVGAIDKIPLFPKLMEVVGLGYSIWFSSRYLLFKRNRDELVSKIEEIKQQVLGPKN